MLRRRGESPPWGLEGARPLLVLVEAQAGRSTRLLEGRQRNRGGEGVGEDRSLPRDRSPAAVRTAMLGAALLPAKPIMVLPEACDCKAAELRTD